jgi:hypothetical protein
VRIDRRVARRQTQWELRADVSPRIRAVVREHRVMHVHRVAVGARLSPTPVGRFHVIDKLRGPRSGAS